MFPQKQKNKLTPKSYQLEASSGFTLIELLISMAIIAVLTGSAIQVARFSDTHKNLTLAADEIRAVIRSAQSSALSIPNPVDRHVCGFGVYFGDSTAAGTNTQYELFYTYVDETTFAGNPKTCDQNNAYRDGSSALGQYEIIERRALTAGTTLAVAILDETIFFKVPYGDVYDDNGDELTVDETFTIESGANSKVITVTPSGQVE